LKEKSKEVLRATPFERKLSDNFIAIYSNLTEINFSGLDVVFDFGTVAPDIDKNIIGEFKLRVFMTPAHAKQFSAILQQGIETYEKTVGKINVPKVEKA